MENLISNRLIFNYKPRRISMIKTEHRTVKWKDPSLSDLTPMIFNTGFTYLGLEASK